MLTISTEGLARRILPHCEHWGDVSDGTHRNGGQGLEAGSWLLNKEGEDLDMEEVLDQHDAQEGGPKGMEEIISHFKELNGETNWGKWEVDQV